MSFGHQKFIAMGALGADPEMRYLQDGTAATTFSLGVQDRKDAPTEWFRCTAWKSTAEFVNENLRKGNRVLVEGRFQKDEWDGADGIHYSMFKLTVDRITPIDMGERNTESRPASKPSSGQRKQAAPQQQKAW